MFVVRFFLLRLTVVDQRLLSFLSTYHLLNLQLFHFILYFFPLMVKSNKKDQACTVLSWKLPRQWLRDRSRASCLLAMMVTAVLFFVVFYR